MGGPTILKAGENMSDWAKAAVGSIVATAIAALSGVVKHLWTKQKAQSEGLKALLHDRLFQACTVCLNRGKITVAEIENIEYLYQPYAALGGNGTGKELHDRAIKLPIISAEQE